MNGARLIRPPAYRIILVQGALLAVVGAALHYAAYPLEAQSLLLGGLIAVVPQAYFSWRVFRHSGVKAAALVARAGYAGEVGKFLLAAGGFALVFAFCRPLAAWAVFAGYCGMLVIQVAGSWFLLRHATPVNRT